MKHSVRILLVGTLGAAMLVSYQNCAPGFTAQSGLASSLASNGSGGGSAGSGTTAPAPVVDSSGYGPGSLKTADKSAGDLTMSKIVTWNLNSEVEDGEPLAGATISISISKYVPPDGSHPVLYITNPTLTTGSRALDLKKLRLGVEGTRNDISTTFQGLNLTVPANTTRVLSNATLIHQLAAEYSTSQTISLYFDLLWPNGVPLPTDGPTPTPPPVLDGVGLYAMHCASCHGSITVSSKRGSTAAQITRSFTTAPSMSFLANTLSAADVNAIANALK